MAIDDPKRALLRHTVATVAYRGAKVLRGVPPEFGRSGLGQGIRAPVEILSHIADLFEWATHLAEGRQVWNEGPPDTWEVEVERFFRELGRFDAVLASNGALHCEAERLFQGPIADALTHFGQLALLRRRAGAPVRGENYFRARITLGVVGPQQAEPRLEFD
jgi:hypothetical protein